MRGKAHGVQQGIRFADIRGRETPQPCFHGRHIAQTPRQHIFHHREAFDEVVFLKHHANLAARSAQLAAIQRHQILALKQDLAGAGLHQTVDATDQRGFAGARRADDGGDAIGGDVERNAGEHRLAGDIGFGQAPNGYRRHDENPGRFQVIFWLLPALQLRAF